MPMFEKQAIITNVRYTITDVYVSWKRRGPSEIMVFPPIDSVLKKVDIYISRAADSYQQ